MKRVPAAVAIAISGLFFALATSCGGSRCAAQDATFGQTGTSCCPKQAGVVWNGHTCVQPHDCGCWTCEGKSCGDAYSDLASCAAAHQSCVK
jgi:hypothetical protein